MVGGYRISNELKKDLIEIRQSAEVCQTIGEIANLDTQDKKSMQKSTGKIKMLVNKWIGEA